MLNLLKDTIRQSSCDYAEIHFEKVRSSSVVYSKDQIESVQTAITSSGNARALQKGGWGFSAFNEDDLLPNLKAAEENATLIGTGKSYLTRSSHPVVTDVHTNYQIRPANISLCEKSELARHYNEQLKHPDIIQTSTVYSDWEIEKYFVNSEGAAIKQVKTFCGMAFSCTAKDGSTIQKTSKSVGHYGGFELVNSLDAELEVLKQRVLDLLKAPGIESGKYRVLLDPHLAGVFAHEAFGHLSEADFLAENPRMQEVMQIGRRFGTENLNIIDDGSLAHLAGYTPYDDEGMPAQKTVLLKNGVLNTRLHSRETAARMNERTSGNARALSPAFQPIVRMTNTYIDNGTQSFEDLLSELDDGIYALDMLGGMTNLEMFTFSAGYGFKVKNGKIRHLVRDIVLSGNVFETLENIIGIGNDLKHHGGLGGCGKAGQNGLPVSTGSPHLLISPVLIGGK